MQGAESTAWQRRAAGIIAVAALVAAVAFRFQHLAAKPFWLDEAYSAYAADGGFAFLWHVVPAYETHPPLYYSLVRVWSLAVGDALLPRRLLGAIAGTGAVAAAALAAAMLGRLAGWSARRRVWLIALATLLVALHPLLIEMSRQLRPYPVIALVYALGTACALRLGIDAAARRPLHRGWLAGAALCEALLFWLHTLGPLYGGSLALAIALLCLHRTTRRGDWIALGVAQVAAGLLYLPAFLIMLGQAPTWIGSTWLRFRPELLPGQLALLYIDWRPGAIWLALAAALAGLGLLVRSGAARAAAALVVLAALPTLASILLSLLVSPVFLTRTLSAVAVPGLLLAAAGLCWPGRSTWAGLGVAAWLAAGEAMVALALAARPPQQDWYGLIAWLRPRLHRGDEIWAYPNEGALPLGTALRDDGLDWPVRPIPAPVPAFGQGGWYPTGSRGVVSLFPRQIEALVRTPGAHRPRTIWLLRLGARKYDPGDRLLGALRRTRRPVGRFHKEPIDVIGLRRDDAPAARVHSLLTTTR